MIFITKIELENFQSHKNSVFNLDRGLNVILGNSDSGKTAILRAIRWVLYNEPSGDQFIRQGETFASATLHFNTGSTVKRFRSSSKNTYYLKKSNGEEFTFDGFGISVPKEIIDEIGISKIKLDNGTDDSINIAQQLDGPFLLNEKTSLRSSAIGRLVGVNYIDDAHRKAIKDNKQILASIKSHNENKENLYKEIQKYNYLTEKENLLNKLKEKRNIISEKEIMLNNLTNISKNLVSVEEEINIISAKLKNLGDLTSLEKNLNVLSEKVYKYSQYDYLYNRNKNLEKDIDYNKNIIIKLKDLSQLEKNILKIENINNHYLYLSKINNYYVKNKDDINSIKKSLTNLSNLNTIDAKISDISEKLEIFKNLNLDLNNLKNYNQSINVGKKYISKFKNIDLAYEYMEKASLKLEQLSEFENLLTKYSNLKSKHEYLVKEVTKNNNEFELKYNQYEEELLKQGHCPICNSKIDLSTVKHLREHFGGM